MNWQFWKKPEPVKHRRQPYVRHYEAASMAARFGDFNSLTMSANAELDNALELMRNRSRALFRNSPYFRRWVNQSQTNIVGASGLMLQVNAKNINGGVDRSGNRKVMEKWQEWIPVVTADGMMSFREACRMVVRQWGRDGECFCEIVRGSQFPHGIALHFFEADLVDEKHNVPRGAGKNMIRQGVEVDRFNRPVAYHVLDYHPGDVFYHSMSARNHRRVPADKIIHVFIKERPGQVRGEPPVVAAMMSSKMLDGYREAEVTGRRLAASKMGFLTREAGGSGDIASIADSVDNDTGQLEMDVHPGRISSLPEGMNFEAWDMKGFSTDYKQFESQIIHAIAMALNTSYVSISGDLTEVSYSSIRAGELSDRDVWRELQKFIVERFAMRVYTEWTDNAFQFTDIRLPYDRREKFLRGSTFRPRGWSWVDPEKEVRAAVEAMENNMTTLTDVVNEQGQDVEEIYRKKQSEADLAAEYPDVDASAAETPAGDG